MLFRALNHYCKNIGTFVKFLFCYICKLILLLNVILYSVNVQCMSLYIGFYDMLLHRYDSCSFWLIEVMTSGAGVCYHGRRKSQSALYRTGHYVLHRGLIG